MTLFWTALLAGVTYVGYKVAPDLRRELKIYLM